MSSYNKKFALFGSPVAHSLSPKLHNSVFTKLEINAFYTLIELNNIESIKDIFNLLDLNGANITLPFKVSAYELCDEIVGIAKDIGTINTIIKKEDKLIGYNSDADGFYNSLNDTYSDVLIIGAGGTAKTLAHILQKNGSNVTVVNRSSKNLKYFKDIGLKTFLNDDIDISGSYDIIINTTSVGLTSDDLPLNIDLLTQLSKNCRLMYDVIYNKNTSFLKLAKKLEISYKDGKEMLIRQALYSNILFLKNIGKYNNNQNEIFNIMKISI